MDRRASEREPGSQCSRRTSTARVGARASIARAALALWIACASCASLKQERHAAPFLSELSIAGGGTEFEALGGAVRIRRPAPGSPVEQWALRPIVIREFEPGGDSTSRFLTPFGTSTKRGSEFTWQLLPITRFYEREYENGELEWTLLTLPGIYWSRLRDGRIVRAWFPFGGVFEEFLSFDRLVFVMFPLFMRSERAGRITYHFLFPIFAYTYGKGGACWRVWPIYGRSRYAGRYDRSFVLWPFFQWEHNDLWLPPEKQERKWFVFPLVGRTARADYHATTILWPFFGFAQDKTTGYWAWDGPWPLVRILRDPKEDTYRTRFWPLYSNYHGNGLDSTWYLWPIINLRHEEYEKADRDSVYVLPFWQSWRRRDEVAGRSSFHKLWPFYQAEHLEEHSSKLSFPALNPLWRTPEIDEMYAWIYELYTRERDHEHLKVRTWLGLYRREKDENEDRSSIAFLWARRAYREGGKEVRETSLLFGLLRWRTRASDSLEWLGPAMPGPGWPLARVANKAGSAVPSRP